MWQFQDAMKGVFRLKKAGKHGDEFMLLRIIKKRYIALLLHIHIEFASRVKNHKVNVEENWFVVDMVEVLDCVLVFISMLIRTKRKREGPGFFKNNGVPS
jgi:hypothetical protein